MRISELLVSFPWVGRGCWLLGLVVQTAVPAQSWQAGPGFQFQQLPISSNATPGFTLLSPKQTGIWMTNVLPEFRFLTNQVLPSGSGVAAGDVDGDGWCDLFFCGLGGGSRLYRNLGNWKFEDVTDHAGAACPRIDATGAVLADIDGDGDLDLLVNSIGGGTRVFKNDGKGQFNANPDILNLGRAGMSLALADADGNGTLDLYIANYRVSTLMDAPGTRFSVRMIDNQPVVTTVNGQPLTDPQWTNRFRFKFAMKPGGRGTFSQEELGEADLFCLNDGKGHFEPVSWTGGGFLDEDGLALAQPPFDWGLSVMFRDFNGDGNPDLYLCNDFRSPDRFWLNDGQGRFHAAHPFALRQISLSSMGIDVADLNRDGHDDFFVVDMLSREHRRRMTQRNVTHAETAMASQIIGRPQHPRNSLFLNRGDGTYAEIAQYAGLDASEWSWGPMFLDVDLDGYEDLLVPNGFERDNMNVDAQNRINQAKAGRRLPSLEELQLRKMFPRLATANLAFRNQGGLRFQEVSELWGFNAATVSQGACLADLDNDGDLDVLVNNMNDPAGVYRNNAADARVGVRLKGAPPNTRGIGAKIRVLGGAVPMQSQEMISGGRYLSSDDTLRVFAAGSTTNVMRIEVQWRGGKQSVVAQAEANRIYEIDEGVAVPGGQAFQPAGFGDFAGSTGDSPVPSGDPPDGMARRVGNGLGLLSSQAAAPIPLGESPIGAGGSPAPPTPNRRESPANRQAGKPALRTPLFHDVSHLLNHTHTDEAFDDFARQPLLPKRLSQLGPGVSWFDLNGDGWEDLIIGSGKGGHLGTFLNDGQGGFKSNAQFSQPITRDQTSVLGWTTGQGKAVLLAGSANYEDGLTTGGCVRQFDPTTRQITDLFAGQSGSVGPLALADVDGDGDLDLFVGGRALAGRYPEAVASALYRNEAQRFTPDEESNRALQAAGMVSGAVFCDLEGDGFPELILACEWGPIRIFRNKRGKFSPWNPEIKLLNDPASERLRARLAQATRHSSLATRHSENSQLSTLNQLTGWWNGVTAGDFDGDGQLDIVASNWGRNSKYENFRARPLRLYHGDLDGEGTVDLIEAHFDSQTQKLVPERMLDVMTKAIPALAERFGTHEAYAQASVEEAFGEWLPRARQLEADWLESTVLLNRQGRFEVVVLPLEAQLSPAFGVCVADYDGDGREDIFLSQNFFGMEADTPRYDAGRGQWLQGNGQGGFRAVPGQESGVRVYGEQRGAALCDYDADGRVDLVVAQNSAETQLYRNVGGRLGLRVRIQGPEENPQGVGAVVSMRFGDRWGPAREIHSGSGYWSQDSAVQVMAMPEPPLELSVRWPGGMTSTFAIPRGTREIVVGLDGKSSLVR